MTRAQAKFELSILSDPYSRTDTDMRVIELLDFLMERVERLEKIALHASMAHHNRCKMVLGIQRECSCGAAEAIELRTELKVDQ